MRPMHKNSGKNEVFRKIGNAYFGYNRAEDPALPWWRRTWEVENDGMRTATIFSMQRSVRDGQAVYFIFAGPFMLTFAWLG